MAQASSAATQVVNRACRGCKRNKSRTGEALCAIGTAYCKADSRSFTRWVSLQILPSVCNAIPLRREQPGSFTPSR